MSIEPMKRMWVVTRRDRLRPLLDLLGSLKAVHLADVTDTPEAEQFFSRLAADPAGIDGRIVRLEHVLHLMNSHYPPRRTFGENFVGFPLEVTSAEMAEALEAVDIDRLDERLTVLADEALSLNHRMEEIRLELRHLTTWREIGGAAPSPFRHCVGYFGTVTARMKRLLDESEKVREILVLNELGRGKDNRVLLQVVALREHRSEAEDLLSLFDFTPLPLPPGVSVRDMIRTLQVELAGHTKRVDAASAGLRELTEKHRRAATSVLAYWETRRDVVQSEERSLGSKRLAVAAGYVRARQADRITGAIRKAFPEAGVEFRDPAPDENVPVELCTNRFFAPAQFLVNMFGLPSYRAFDPTAFIMLNFLLFFGFCFGDVVYGAGLIVVSLWIVSRVKAYPGLKNLFTLLAWGGVSTMIFGALTGSWASDLPELLGGDNVLIWVKSKLTVLDMMKDPVVALLISLGIGVLNQFYGIIMKIYTEYHRRNYQAALFDGGLWLVVLPGLILLVARLFAPQLPTWVTRTGLIMVAAGAAGLVLTQGRHEKSFAAKAIIGFVSIYGILGSYGATAFIGDTLSYCRLLALGLTTSIVGMCFNIIAGLARDIPVAGVAAFGVVLLVGHVFNFLISILGAFVHSARLIFVEFFGRFYEIGGVRFHALGTSERVRVIDESP